MAELVSNLMELLHDESLPSIGALQASFPNNHKFMINISTLFDPRYVFLIYAPLLFALNRRVGQRMIIALTWAEWANQVLKWLLAGERPYWYVHERANELAQRRNLTAATLAASSYLPGRPATASGPLEVGAGQLGLFAPLDTLPGQLRQFPVTCELGAGSPSGHAMVTATVWYILIDALLRGELGVARAGSLLARASWSAYLALLLLVSLSRVYLACHFPHQCLAGALLGCLLARLVARRLPMERLARNHFVLATCWMFASAMATYGLLRLWGFDPLWSVGKATRWCAKPEYIHPDTTPFFSMMRYLGFCLGAGLAYDSAKLGRHSCQPPRALERAERKPAQAAARRLAGAALAIGFGQLLLALPMPRSQQELFYGATFLLYTLFAYAIAGPIPDMIGAAAAAAAATASHPLAADLRAHLQQIKREQAAWRSHEVVRQRVL